MQQGRKYWLTWMAGIVISSGLATGLAWGTTQPVRAATQVSTATQTSEEQTVSDADFEKQIQAPIPDSDTIAQAFPDEKLRQVVASALGAKPTDNLKKMVEQSRLSGDWVDMAFIISPTWSVAPVTKPILNWTGLSAIKNLFGIISIEGQPDFDQKAAKLVQCIGVNQPLMVQLLNDDLTTKGFNELVDLSSAGISYNELDVSQNQVTDFSAIDKLAYSGPNGTVLNGTVQGLPESGSVQDKSGLRVSDSSAIIKGGVPGTSFLPKTLTIDPMKNGDSIHNVGMFRLETPAQTASFAQFSGNTFPKAESSGLLTHPVTLNKINAFNRVDFNDHEWHYIFPWYRAVFSQWTELESGDVDPTTIDFDQFKNIDLEGIPNDASSVTIRTLWANAPSQILNSPYTTLVNIPLTRDSSVTSSATTAANSESTSSSQATSASSTTDHDVAVKGQAVYAIKKVGLYRQPTFAKQNRHNFYPREPRIRRPQFVVIGYGRSEQGRLRYRVRDVNHTSSTFGRQGYVTTQSAYITKTYYQRNPKKIRVINPKGINTYRKVNLTHRVKHYRRGQVLRIVALKHYHLTTRLKLASGQYVTANKTLIKMTGH